MIMNTLKHFFCFISIFFAVSTCFAQDDTKASTKQDNFSVQFAQCYATFKYMDSDGNKDMNLISDINFCYGASYTKEISHGIFLRPEIGYKNYGATSYLNTQKLKWSLHYLDANLSLGYNLKIGKIEPGIFVSYYCSYLYKAEQNIGVDSYDMIKNKIIETNDYGINIGARLQYLFSANTGFFIEYRKCFGLNQLEKNYISGSNQKMYNRASSIHFGLSFKIDKKENKLS